jgi:hypothetical protein
MRRLIPGLLLSAGAVLALCPAGCRDGSNRLPESGATLAGKVTYDGKKVPGALIIAAGDGEFPAAQAFANDEGQYKLVNVPLGEVRIGVNTKAGEEAMQGRRMAQGKGAPPLPTPNPVPARFHNPSDAITTTVHEGENKFDIVVPKK